jgi:hypothetical protein
VPAAAESEGAAIARYIVFEIDSDGAVRPQMHRLVRLAVAPRSLTPGEVEARLVEPFRGVERVRVRMFDAAGVVAFEDVVPIPKWTRAEGVVAEDFAGDGKIDGRLLVSERRSFVVRIPVTDGSWLALSVPRDDGRSREAAFRDAEFDLDALASDATLPLARFMPEMHLRSAAAANSGNRADLLIMGDGYTAAEHSKFDSDAANLVSQFFSLSPYDAYRNFFNTATLFTASAQSGADHPPYDASCAPSLYQQCCADTVAQSDPKAGTFVDTAFDSTYCSNNAHRALVLNPSRVLAAAAAAPDWDKVVALVNDSTYGGTGGVVAVISTNPLAVNIAQHELGHSFTGLADEYDLAYPAYPACSDKTAPACEPNATDQLDRGLTKWTSWISGATPLPTPETAQYADSVGLFEGARYQTTGFYRPKQNCLMNALGRPFCPICTQAFVLRLYQGGFGVPASGIDPIEPGSESPAPGFVAIPFPGNRTFSVGLLEPAGGNLSTSWLVDGAAVPGATSSSFTYTPASQGSHRVEVRTKDTTPLVNATMGGTALESSRVWTVGAGQGGARFQIQVDWAVPSQGRSGVGTEVSLTPDTRYFWFFSPANVELVIKVLDARAVNGKYWVFYGALSSVQYTIRITDTVTGAVKTYTNPSGALASVADTEAFAPAPAPSEPGAPLASAADVAWALEAQARAGFAPGAPLVSSLAAPAPAAVCAPDATTLCLNGGRFQLRVNWAVPSQGRSGTGKAVSLTSDTGYFWFFSEANVELVIKALDARPVNGHYWIFYGALSSVQYTITVTDMQTGAVKTYQNPSGTLASVADTSAF